MTIWDPAQYRKFAGQRLRPALDLVAAVPLDAPATIVDLGCGEGQVTRVLRERWPQAALTAVDDSAAMLTVAARELPEVDWRRGDIATWRPEAPVDLLLSNAALHWLPDHATLFPDLFRSVAPGGVLAVQMPRNFDQPSHTAIQATAAAGPWKAKLAPLVRTAPVAAPADYHGWLAGEASALDIWETTYLQVLEGDNPVAEWTKGTWLRPFLDALGPGEREAFEAAYRARVSVAYPKDAAGRTLFPFRRLFVVAVRA
jgi:trans-aconitate 2-methyltransferase